MIQQKQQAVEENISNITSASGEAASFSSCNRNDIITTGGIYSLQHFTPLNQTQPQEVKKKRNQPGNPDPEAEVIALSPKSLLATNRFVCEICNKGFQRDQNLQLHKRGHNLPWKLKKRTNNEVIRKKVYVCPEQSCVHHDPSRALGDLTGIKKHFCRKHGEKKWKCEKCSKRYAVQSDWKAHSKTCGAKEYRCECGTIFSRRDSFITHRAFCDALSVQSSRAITRNPIFPSHMNIHFQPVPQFNNHEFSAAFSMKKEQTSHDFNLRHDQIPPWLMTGHQFVGGGPGPPPPADCSSSFFHATRFDQEYVQSHQDLTSTHLHENPNPKLGGGTVLQAPPYTGEADAASPHISAIAMLQKAAELGATMSKKANAVSVSNTGLAMLMSPHKTHVSATDSAAGITKQTDQFGLNFSSRDQQQLTSGLINSFGSYENKAAAAVTSGPPIMTSFATEFEGSTFEDMMMTKDFLGLRPLSHTEIFNVAGLVDNDQHQFQNHVTWES